MLIMMTVVATVIMGDDMAAWHNIKITHKPAKHACTATATHSHWQRENSLKQHWLSPSSSKSRSTVAPSTE